MDELQIKSDSLQELFNMWKSPTGDIPHESAIDPYLIPKKLFPYIALYEVHYDPMRFMAKLVGNALIHHVGKDFQGCFLDEINAKGTITPVIEWHKSSVQNRKASICDIPFITGDAVEIPTQRLFLPYRNDENILSKFISATALLEEDRSFILP